jgi:hypothetical protein
MQLLSTLLEACSLEEAKHLVFAYSPLAEVEKTQEETGSVLLVKRALDHGVAVCESSVWIRAVTSESVGSKSGYRDASLSRMLRLMTGNSSEQQVVFRRPVSDDRGFISGSLFDLTLRKLRSFLTLKYDEQVAVTGLVERCITVFAVLAVQAGEDFSLGVNCTSKIVEMSQCSCDLIDQLSVHLNRISDCESKIAAVRSVLVDPHGADQRSRKMIENENQQVLRILETGVLIRELFSEIEGGLLAIEHLTGMLYSGGVNEEEADVDTNGSPQARPPTDSFFDQKESFSSDEEDECSDDGDFDMKLGGLGELGNLISEESFLSACAGLEESLEDILRANEMVDNEEDQSNGTY